MKIFVKVRTGVEDNVEKVDDNHFVISVLERPIKGQANRGVIRVLANYFKVTKSEVSIKSGFTSSNKIIEINI